MSIDMKSELRIAGSVRRRTDSRHAQDLARRVSGVDKYVLDVSRVSLASHTHTALHEASLLYEAERRHRSLPLQEASFDAEWLVAKDPAAREATELPTRAVSKRYRTMWVVIAAISMFWGVVTGASIFGGVGIDQASAVFGMLATAGLAATVFAMGTRTPNKKA